ncbi:KamA family radical SAM protein [Verrucomicrobiota bacterium]
MNNGLCVDVNQQDWQWQLRNRITTGEQLEQHLALTGEEREGLQHNKPTPPFAVTPYYAGLLSLLGNDHPLRKAVIPQSAEQTETAGERSDPLGEEGHSPLPGLVHTYPDKVLLLATTQCSTYCRYCTRSRMAGQGDEQTIAPLEERIAYIAENSSIRDVLISGGDPLTLTDSVLENLLSKIRAIPHVRLVRIGSKVPAVLPMRISDSLCAILRKYNVWLSLHFIHAAELSPETRAACLKLSGYGIPMVSQTVLLKGINDRAEVIRELMYSLLEAHVKPYYLLQCDPVSGTGHFRTSIEKGLEIVNALHGNISGLAVPQFVVDAPGGGGKVPLLSTKQLSETEAGTVLINYQGNEYVYPSVTN